MQQGQKMGGGNEKDMVCLKAGISHGNDVDNTYNQSCPTSELKNTTLNLFTQGRKRSTKTRDYNLMLTRAISCYSRFILVYNTEFDLAVPYYVLCLEWSAELEPARLVKMYQVECLEILLNFYHRVCHFGSFLHRVCFSSLALQL